MKIRLLAIFTLLFFSLPAWAIYPLVLTQEFQLPVSGPWDVRHVTSDSTFGWAQVSNDTIFWVEELGQPVQYIILPQEIDSLLYYERHFVEIVQLFLPPGDQAHLHAMLTIHHGIFGWWSRMLVAIDLVTGDIFALQDDLPGEYDDLNCFFRWYSIVSFIMYPCLPEQSRFLYIGFQEDSYFDCMGEHEERSIPEVMVFRISPDTFEYIDWMHDGFADIDFSSDPSTHYAVMGGIERFYYWTGEYSDTTEYRRWTVVSFPDSSFGVPDTMHGGPIAAQVDGDGTQRIIVEDCYNWRRTLTALNPDDYSVLWQIPSHEDPFWSFKLAGSGDERLIVLPRNASRFQVYDASNGAQLGETTPILGELMHILKPNGHPAEIVTCDQQTHTVRIYTSQSPIPDNLTIYYLPGDAQMQLQWSEIVGASGYTVYSASTPDGPWQEVVTLFGNQITYHLPAVDSQKFFRVTAVYEE